MSSEAFAEMRITPAPPERWGGALDLVFSRLGGEAGRRQVAQALAALRSAANQAAATSAAPGGHQSRCAVFEACRGDERIGAVWVQLQPGRTASFEPAQVAAEVVSDPADADRIAQALTDAAISFAVAGGARLIQTLLETDVGTDARRLQSAGFQHAAELLYMVSESAVFPTAPPTKSLEFEPLGADTSYVSPSPLTGEGRGEGDRARFVSHLSPPTPLPQGARGDEGAESGETIDRIRTNRLAEMVQRTYVGTLDCPQLDGARPIDEILTGYRAVGSFNPARWLLIRHAARDVGCLLLAEHPQRIWELIYMGLTPESRGHGWGLEITRHAQWIASRAGAQRMVLAVDANNEPAIKMYAAAGLKAWDRRSAWLKILR